MFSSTDYEFHKEMTNPFIQNEKYCSTDGHALVTLPVSEIELDFKPQEKPNTARVLVYDKPFSRTISIEALKAVISKFAPMVDECKVPAQDCDECYGSGTSKAY